MIKLITTTLALLTLPSIGFSAGEVTPFSVTSQILNFLLLFGFIIYKVKKPLSNYFQEKSNNIQQFLKTADSKFKESQIKLSDMEQKLGNKEAEKEQILKEMGSQLQTYRTELERETKAKIEKTRSDAQKLFESERLQKVKQANQSLVEKIIFKAKGVIQGDKSIKAKATDKLMGRIRV